MSDTLLGFPMKEVPEEQLLNIKQIHLSLNKLSVKNAVAKELLDRSHINLVEDFVTHNMYVSLERLVASWESDANVSVPKDWWQHFKLRWFPRWARKRWPVVYLQYNARVILPEVPCPLRDRYEMVIPVWEKREGD